MTIINTSFSNFFAGAELILNNAQQHPDIAAALEVFGYDAATLQEGQDLLIAARSRYDAQIREYGEQHAATQAFKEATKQADKTYSTHRRLAKIAFKQDPQRQTDLRLNDRKPSAFNPWYEQARHFYTALLADTDAQTRLARYRITLDVLQTAQGEVTQAFALNSSQEREKGEAQSATQDRDGAVEALDEWLSEFKAIARIALDETPQLLEALNLGAIP